MSKVYLNVIFNFAVVLAKLRNCRRRLQSGYHPSRHDDAQAPLASPRHGPGRRPQQNIPPKKPARQVSYAGEWIVL